MQQYNLKPKLSLHKKLLISLIDIWKTSNIFEITSFLWYVLNCIDTLWAFLQYLYILIFKNAFIWLDNTYFYYIELHKKDHDSYKELVNNYEIWIGRAKDKEKFKAKYKIETKCYNYCKSKLDEYNRTKN